MSQVFLICIATAVMSKLNCTVSPFLWQIVVIVVYIKLPMSVIYFPVIDSTASKSDFLTLLQEIRKAFIDVGLDEEKKDTNEWYEIRRKLIPHMESVQQV